MVGAAGLDTGLLGGVVIGEDTVEGEVELGSIPLLETPSGEQPQQSPRLLGYGGGYAGYGSGSSGYGTGYPPYGGGELVMMAGGTHVGVESLAQASVILVIGVAIIISNIIILATFITMPGPKDVIMYYLMSLGVSDLVAGVVVVPLSVYPALVQRWVYGDALCGLAGYLETTLWFAQLCTFMWISVDRYLAIRKPLRYETVQTKTRCQCWVVFTWITSMMLCCPPLLGFNSSSHWDDEAFVCWLDWGSMIAYAFTLIPMVLGPTLITLFYTYGYIFNTMRRLKTCVVGQDKEFITALTSNLANPDHAMSFVLVLAFWLSWGPCVGVRTYEYISGHHIDVRFLHFAVFWLGALNSCWKSIIYIAMSPKFRRGLKLFCLSLCCQRKARNAELIMDY
ncbi:probable G-protein coupled receptor 21 [Procambarus clarkii]|uniref:probable G-protein coupled receptor 21 n=1 Tax=Procambarus clarkii TaxID=6728 RepID=UPI001E67749C|nr:probable G-protein coupled receptor 21 [Procambarus clarkii]